MISDMETVIGELSLPNLFVGGGMMGSTKERMMVWKEEEEKEEVEEEESTVRTLQINSGNIQALPVLLCLRNLHRVRGIFLSQALQQASRTGNIWEICL